MGGHGGGMEMPPNREIPPEVLAQQEALKKAQEKAKPIDIQFKELPDDPNIPLAKLDKLIMAGWMPYNYDPKTGVVND